MKSKSTVIVSGVILFLILIGLVVGLSAAWFGNVGSLSNTIIITSARPQGQAIINVDAVMNSSEAPSTDVLAPAVVKPGFLQNPANIGVWNNLNTVGVANGAETAKFDPLNDIFVDAPNGSDNNKPLTSTATTVTITFPFAYIGAADSSASDGLKGAKITLSHATIEDPKVKPAAEQTNFLGEFGYSMRLVKAHYGANKTDIILDTDVNGNVVDDDSVRWVQSISTEGVPGRELQMLIYPGVDYFFEVTLYFSKVDEMCSPKLRAYKDLSVYFNFGIAAVPRSQLDVLGAVV